MIGSLTGRIVVASEQCIHGANNRGEASLGYVLTTVQQLGVMDCAKVKSDGVI